LHSNATGVSALFVSQLLVMTTCYKCDGTEIVKGKIRRSSEEFFSDIVFGPDGTRRFFALTFEHGTKLQEESYGCLKCGAVWSQTDPEALRAFIQKHYNKESDETPFG
jgi:hypothetical protein